MKILLTGFDPFDREKVNPAFEAVKLLPDTIAGAQIVKLEVPTQFVRAGEVLEAAMAEHKPDVVSSERPSRHHDDGDRRGKREGSNGGRKPRRRHNGDHAEH